MIDATEQQDNSRALTVNRSDLSLVHHDSRARPLLVF